MALAYQQGTILVESGTTLPGAVTLDPPELSRNWQAVRGLDRLALEAEVSKAGWTWFYMAGPVTRYAFGRNQKTRTGAALGRMLDDIEAQKCNCVEITRIAAKSFLGVPYVSVTGNARHIQDGYQFNGR
jgi:hypothetical protein